MPRPGQGVGRAAMEHIAQASLSAELIYAFVLVFISLMIYFGTKELYELTNHKGIKYFRLSFLFFAISIFIRSILKFLVFVVDPEILIKIIFSFGNIIAPAIVFLFMYFSSMAIFFLLYSVMCKKWDGKSHLILILNLIAGIIALISIVSSAPHIVLGIYIVLFLFVAFIAIMAYKESKNKKRRINLYAVYVLLFIFWTLNIVDILIPSVLQTFQILIYAISLSLFLMILYKVLKKTP